MKPAHDNRLIVINSSNKFWGAEISLMVFLKGLQPNEYSLLLREDGEGFSSELKRKGLEYSTLEMELSPFRMKFFKSALQILRLFPIRQRKSVYANNEDLSTLVAVLKILRAFRLRTYLHIRTTPGKYDYYKKLMFLHDGVICNSDYTKRMLLQHIPFKRQKNIHVILNSHGQSVSSQGVNENPYPYFVTLGRVSAAKGQIEVVKALKEMRDQPEVNYLIVGTVSDQDSYVRDLRAYLDSNKMNDRVSLLPFRDNLSSIYKNAVATIVSSKQETFGRVVIESGFYGTPVIVRNIEPLVDLITDGESGLVWNGSRDHLTELMERISSDMEYRNFLGENLRNLVLKVYSDDRYRRELKELIIKG